MEEEQEFPREELIIANETSAPIGAANSNVIIYIPPGVYDLNKSSIACDIVFDPGAGCFPYARLDFWAFLEGECLLIEDGKQVGSYQNLTLTEELYQEWKYRYDRINEEEILENYVLNEDLIQKRNWQQFEFESTDQTLELNMKEMFPFIWENEDFLEVKKEFQIEFVVSQMNALAVKLQSNANRVIYAAKATTQYKFEAFMCKINGVEDIQEPLNCIESLTETITRPRFEFECGPDKLCEMQGFIITDTGETIIDAPLVVAANVTNTSVKKNGEIQINGATFEEIVGEFRSHNGNQNGESCALFLVDEKQYLNSKILYEIEQGTANNVTCFFEYVMEE